MPKSNIHEDGVGDDGGHRGAGRFAIDDAQLLAFAASGDDQVGVAFKFHCQLFIKHHRAHPKHVGMRAAGVVVLFARPAIDEELHAVHF